MREKKELSRLYYKYVESELYPTKEYTKISNKFLDKTEKLEKHLTKKQKKELDKIIDLIFSMNLKEGEQTFIYAYTLGARLTTEILYN